ncbi:MAG: integrase core domain-containing protein [Candidatus Margulisbacteria bacterium]|jgi:transposase InsO family protein|nr:integrase core domain-containing protein [Candidatus Margulisiibacteriota bacterium]
METFNIERANRSLDEEFIAANLYRYDADFCLAEFNSKLLGHLIWYNTKRVHKSLGNITPLDFMNTNLKSHMYGTYTLGCILLSML